MGSGHALEKSPSYPRRDTGFLAGTIGRRGGREGTGEKRWAPRGRRGREVDEDRRGDGAARQLWKLNMGRAGGDGTPPFCFFLKKNSTALLFQEILVHVFTALGSRAFFRCKKNFGFCYFSTFVCL